MYQKRLRISALTRQIDRTLGPTIKKINKPT